MGPADTDPAGVLSKVALVPQDYTCWPPAADENIALCQPRPYGDAAVHAAAEAAGADSVNAPPLPHGLDAPLARSWWEDTICPAGSGSASQFPAPSTATLPYWCRTSRPPRSTPAPSTGSAPGSEANTAAHP